MCNLTGRVDKWDNSRVPRIKPHTGSQSLLCYLSKNLLQLTQADTTPQGATLYRLASCSNKWTYLETPRTKHIQRNTEERLRLHQYLRCVDHNKKNSRGFRKCFIMVNWSITASLSSLIRLKWELRGSKTCRWQKWRYLQLARYFFRAEHWKWWIWCLVQCFCYVRYL